MQIKIFNIATWVIYLVVFNELINQNKFVIETDTHIKFIEYDKSKKIPYKATHVKNLMKKNQYFFLKINLYIFF